MDNELTVEYKLTITGESLKGKVQRSSGARTWSESRGSGEEVTRRLRGSMLTQPARQLILAFGTGALARVVRVKLAAVEDSTPCVASGSLLVAADGWAAEPAAVGRCFHGPRGVLTPDAEHPRGDTERPMHPAGQNPRWPIPLLSRRANWGWSGRFTSFRSWSASPRWAIAQAEEITRRGAAAVHGVLVLPASRSETKPDERWASGTLVDLRGLVDCDGCPSLVVRHARLLRSGQLQASSLARLGGVRDICCRPAACRWRSRMTTFAERMDAVTGPAFCPSEVDWEHIPFNWGALK